MRKVTMMDIAKIANVSKTTVSMVINNRDSGISKETRKNIRYSRRIKLHT